MITRKADRLHAVATVGQVHEIGSGAPAGLFSPQRVPAATPWRRSVAAPTGAARRARSARLLRPIFLLVDEFHARCRRGTQANRLAAVLNAVIEVARQGLGAAASTGGPVATLMSLDGERCLRDLEILLGDLLEGECPPEVDLLHAMDALIVHCVRIDAGAAPAD